MCLSENFTEEDLETSLGLQSAIKAYKEYQEDTIECLFLYPKLKG